MKWQRYGVSTLWSGGINFFFRLSHNKLCVYIECNRYEQNSLFVLRLHDFLMLSYYVIWSTIYIIYQTRRLRIKPRSTSLSTVIKFPEAGMLYFPLSFRCHYCFSFFHQLFRFFRYSVFKSRFLYRKDPLFAASRIVALVFYHDSSIFKCCND